MRSAPVTEADLALYQARVRGERLPASPEKRHKYNSRRVIIDGHTFPSKWEGQVYCDLKWRAMAGQITEPLLQVRFSLGEHYGRERFYVADLVHVELATWELVVTEAKGMLTEEYTRKKRVFEEVYGIQITEVRKAACRRKL